MKLLKPLFLGLPLLIAAVVCAPASAAAASGSPTLELHYGTNVCNFLVNQDGVQVTGTQPGTAGKMTATGTFDFVGSDCPTGGGNTGLAAINHFSITDLNDVPVTSVPVNDKVKVSWSAVADICTYAGTSLPAPLPGWPTAGNACIGAYACAQGHSVSPTLSVGGSTYKFGLNCTSGANATGQPESTAPVTASVAVIGAPPPPSETCVAPAGLTRQTSAPGADFSGVKGFATLDVTKWDKVFGYDVLQNSYAEWPGFFNGGWKISVNKNQYIAMAFKVGNNYPYYTLAPGWDGSAGPFGSWTTSASDTTNTTWTVTISSKCGDFPTTAPVPDAVGDPRGKCTVRYGNSSSQSLFFVVTSPNDTISNPGFCHLNRGQSYFLNIVAAKPGTPTESECKFAVCKNNWKLTGNFNGTQGQ